jgi:hypothetical protein
MRHRLNDLVEISTVVPLWIAGITKIFSKGFFFNIGTKTQNEINEFINREEYDNAEKLIENAENEWGYSSFTVRLSTRISRIRTLGK